MVRPLLFSLAVGAALLLGSTAQAQTQSAPAAGVAPQNTGQAGGQSWAGGEHPHHHHHEGGPGNGQGGHPHHHGDPSGLAGQTPSTNGATGH